MRRYVYGACACQVWPLDVNAPIGKCGKCRKRPQRLFETKEQAEADGLMDP